MIDFISADEATLDGHGASFPGLVVCARYVSGFGGIMPVDLRRITHVVSNTNSEITRRLCWDLGLTTYFELAGLSLCDMRA